MMTNPISFDKYKNKKKYSQVINDLTNIIRIHSLTISALKFFSKYIIVMDTIIVLESNKLILESHLQKLKNMVE